MDFAVVRPDQRFDQTAFSNEIIENRALPLHAIYTCPKCSTQVRFSKRDFVERARAAVSNLEPALQRVLDEWAWRNRRSSRPFLDWRCPHCALPVRVYASPWVGGRHGDSGVDLDVVLEGCGGDDGS